MTDKKKNYSEKLSNLAGKFKTEEPKMPIQEVSPVKKSAKEEEQEQFNRELPKTLIKRIKQYCLDNELTLNEITMQAFEAFLSSEKA